MAPLRRVGVFGGSFDPVHVGHLLAAQDALETMELDQVIFMPTAQAPLKQRPPDADGAVRLRLLAAAIADEPRFSVSDLELKRGGESYTIDTARELKRREPDGALFWIIGADQAMKLADWRSAEELGRLVEFIVLARPGYDFQSRTEVAGVRLHQVSSHVFDISSSEIRDRIATGRSVRYFLPSSVIQIIQRESLYT